MHQFMRSRRATTSQRSGRSELQVVVKGATEIPPLEATKAMP